MVWSCALGNRLELIQMKKMLLILMILASAAMANDAKMKALITGIWRSECDSSDITEYKSDGTVTFKLNGTDVVEKWDIKDGALLETDSIGNGRTNYYKILFLTKREWLMLGMTVHAKGYFFFWRKDEDL
jgi:hypothetical protein